MNQLPRDLNEIYKATESAQSEAANPANSAFVSANAGTGKTHILVNRVLRLLLKGDEPGRILCLTYTKAAAAEMENRLFNVLSKWVTMSEDELNETLVKLLGSSPNIETKEIARRLFARAIETPGGMKVLTIHGFCEKLLQRFPLEADIPPNFNVLDETEAREILSNAIEEVLRAALKTPNSNEAIALKEVIAYSTDAQFDNLIHAALSQRSIWGAKVASGGDAVMRSLLNILELDEKEDRSALIDKMLSVAPDELIESSVSLLRETGGKQNDKRAEKFSSILKASSKQERIANLQQAFLTAKNEPLAEKSIATKDARETDPGLISRLIRAQQLFFQAFINYEKLNIAIATTELLQLADKITTSYERQKALRSGLDYQDLIERTAKLLTTRQDAAWVLYKLDQGLDHILVDEAQDTSPDQWQVIAELTAEFFAGLGASEETRERTLFAVGDEKQSIYGFQGAEPKQFAEMGKKFNQRAKSAGKSFKNIPLTLSFRSTSAILQAVDHVFSDPQQQKALTQEESGITHFSYRSDEAGLVELWPTERQQREEKDQAFTPLVATENENAKLRLCQKIAHTIKDWVEKSEILKSKGRPITPGDILILVRRRTQFAAPMIQALKSLNIPVAGADRIILTNELSVMDMMALGEFLLLPEDDLSLANVLKSPIFDLDDDDLFKLCYGRKGSLWQSLRYFAKREDKYEAIARTLSQWLSRADIMPPFEFFASLLEGEGLRRKFIARLGAVAGDALDEFLNLCLQYDELEPPSLQGFLTWLQRTEAETKRDMEKGRDEVRVMTVHGAKGLEAEIVFLPDTCSTKTASQSDSLLTINKKEQAAPDDQQALLWTLSNKGYVPAVKQARATRDTKEREEQMRLLYVAMTRAKDRLYITGFEGVKGRDKNCWYNIIENALQPHMKQHLDAAGNELLRLETGKSVSQIIEKVSDDKPLNVPPMPEYFQEKAPHEPVRTIPVTPSSIIPYETPEDDEEKLPIEPALLSPRQLGSEGRFIRGRLVHKLLEYLPDIEPGERRSAAETLSKHHGRPLTINHRKTIIDETLAILENPDFAPLFGPGSMAEVSLVAKLTPKKTGRTPILLSGQVDRLIVRDNEILIVDYKSNRPSPRRLEDVAESYQAQLAAYRIALREIYPNHSVKSALLWTDGPFFMEIPSDYLDKYEAILNQKN